MCLISVVEGFPWLSFLNDLLRYHRVHLTYGLHFATLSSSGISTFWSCWGCWWAVKVVAWWTLALSERLMSPRVVCDCHCANSIGIPFVSLANFPSLNGSLLLLLLCSLNVNSRQKKEVVNITKYKIYCLKNKIICSFKGGVNGLSFLLTA